MKRVLGAATFMAATVTLGLSWATIGNAACGKVSIAEMNWASAGLMANVDKIILEKGYGCEVELVAGDTMPTFTSMNEKGMPDVAPELWANAVVEPLSKATAEGRLVIGNKAPISGLGEGWWLSPYTAKKHNLSHLRQKYIQHFSPLLTVVIHTLGTFVLGTQTGILTDSLRNIRNVLARILIGSLTIIRNVLDLRC
jgi:ABC-type proline/glycine betaine transport system substrate-binding protein